MKEFLPMPDSVELLSLLTTPTGRKLGVGDPIQDRIWQKYFSVLVGNTDYPETLGQDNLVKESATQALKAIEIAKVLESVKENDLPENTIDLENQIIRASTSFHIRYKECEFRLSIDSITAVKLFNEAEHRPANFDIYGPSGSTRVRFSPEFKQVRLNVKVPISETPDGKRTRLKFEYRGDLAGNDNFVEKAKIIALAFLSEDGEPFLIKQGVEVIKRDLVNLPVWINRQLILEDQYVDMFKDKTLSVEEKLILFDNILNNPEKFTHPGGEYWLEIDANDEIELQKALDNYASRSDSEIKCKVFSTAKIMK